MEQESIKKVYVSVLITAIITSTLFGAAAGFASGLVLNNSGLYQTVAHFLSLEKISETKVPENQTITRLDEESDIIKVVDKVSPAVVSIIVTKDLPKIEQYYSSPFGGSDFFQQFFGDDFGGLFGTPQYRQNGTEKQEIGGGTGFIVSNDGYIITNKHVASDEAAEYTVLMNDEKKYDAKVLARDPINDLAVLKIEAKDLPTVEFGDSKNLKVGQTVIAIGNALGEFRNTVSTGVVSGLSRSITAGGVGIGSEQLSGVIQTDASINPGNSGGPLLNLAGQVIGINTAIVQGAQNIGFAIPIDTVASTIESVKQNGRIVRPWLGVRYSLITEDIAKSNKLDVDYGALIIRGENQTDLAVIPGSPADKAGLVENDIILEVDGRKITEDNPLTQLIASKNVGDTVTLKILHKGEKKEAKVKLEEMKE